MITFGDWLLNEMETRGFTQADLASRARVTQSAISHVISGRRKPGVELCNAIANAFRIPRETVFRAAGLLPPQPDYDPTLEELEHIFTQMTDAEKEEFLASGRLKIELRLARQRTMNPSTKPRTG